MKKLIALIALVCPLLANAGPEDYSPGAVYQATSPVPYYLMDLVFDTVHLSDDESKLVFEARYGNFTGEFNVTKSSRKNEDKVRYTAEKVILNKWDSGCGSGELAKAVVDGVSDISTGISAKDLTITVTYITAVDTCHSRPQTQVITYKLAQ